MFTDNVIKEIITEQQGKALSNWTGFADTPTTKADVEKGISSIPKRFHFKPRGVAQPTHLLTKGVPTQLSESMGLLSGGEAKQLANYLRRNFFREVVYVRFQTKLPKKTHICNQNGFLCHSQRVTRKTVSVANVCFLHK